MTAALPTVENPIINSPYEEPRFHWQIRKGELPRKREGRRPAAYFFRIPEGAGRGRGKKAAQVELFESDTPGTEVELLVPNQIRERLKLWQAREYEGATATTKELLRWWRREDRPQRLFFAQLEAAEAVILLTEGPQDLLQGLPEQIPLDEPGPAAKAKGYKAFQRYGLKMATGTGKTTVMAMLAAWSILNRLQRPDDERFADTVLVICPNVTIRDRLRELDPLQGDLSLYATRDLVPAHRRADLRRGDVIVTNWHGLALQEMREVNGVSAKVVKRGVPVTRRVTRTIDGEKVEVEETLYFESDKAFADRILGKRRGRSPSVLVLNDEAHHAYRRGDNGEDVVLDRELAAQFDREATIWIEGLDRINKVLGARNRNGIRLCVDLSATPFYIQGSGNEVGKPFPWLVSDFSLLDAIEAGMVKIPMLTSADISGDERPAYFNIWRWVQAQLEAEGVSGEPSPADLMRYAVAPMNLLAKDWEQTAAEWQADFAAGFRKTPAPPVFIVVCRNTALAKEVYAWLAEGKADHGTAPECFRNLPGKPVTVRIDSKVAEEIESGAGSDEARRLRFVMETVGKSSWPGGKVPEEYAALVAKHNAKAAEDDSDLVFIDPTIPPGRDVRCIISVAMLSEGWDATTVTHVVGLRPFGSQLLCEQVVGRALRRTRYDMDEDTGLLIGESASVLGVPFELIPLKLGKTQANTAERKIHHVFAVESKAQFEIRFPVVEGYDDPGLVNVTIDWASVPSLVLDPLDVPDSVLMRPMVSPEGELMPYGPGQSEVLDLAGWRRGIREQKVAFDLAAVAVRRFMDDHGNAVPAHRLFPKLLTYAQRYLQDRVMLHGDRQRVDVALNPYFAKALDAICHSLQPVGHERSEGERARIPRGSAGVRSTALVDFDTTRKVWGTVSKCHLNLCVADTGQWEQSAAYCLDVHPAVEAWVKNDHLGLLIPYRKGGQPHNYVPDFIVRLTDQRMLIVEVKGKLGDAEIKLAAAHRWVNAVNRERTFGQWQYRLVKHPADLIKLLTELTGQDAGVGMLGESEESAERVSTTRAATANDWPDLQPMSRSHERISLDLAFTARQMRNLRRGFIPLDQDQKWFLYFEDSTLHIHRSWTGYKMFEVVFAVDGDTARARIARVNLDPECYSGTLDEARETLLDLLQYYASDEAHEPYEPSFVSALREAAQPNYLGSPQVVGELLLPFFKGSLSKELPRYVSGLEAMPEFEETSYSDLLTINQRITSVLCGEDEAFHGLEAWRTEQGLGQAIIHQLGVDAGWYADENLTCIVSEGLAGVSSQITGIVDDWANEDAPLDFDDLMHYVAVLQQFTTSIVLGTHTVLFPGISLSDFTWENRMRFVRLDDEVEQEAREEEELLPGPPVHPRPDDKGKPVKLTAPSTPTALWTWQGAASTAVVIPDGPMPTELAGIGFDSWRGAPMDNAGWEQLAAQSLIDEPPFAPPPGKKAAAGVVVVERDGRVWVVAPSNAFGNYPATFPKGTRDAGMSLQGTALREAFEEAGLRVELTGFLVDVARSTSHTRYYLARRLSGNPADMGWESQCVMLTPVNELATLLTNKSDAPIIQAIKALASQ